ncbi:MAG: cation:proton antiporter [Bacillota bacterium]
MLLSLALMIITGFILSEAAQKLRLPRIIGMMATGMVLGPFVLDWLAPELLAISSDLRRIALVVILLRAGLSLDLGDLRKVGRPAFLLAFIPATFELVAVILLAPPILGFTYLEAALLGSILAAVSPAIVVPRMLRMMKEKHGTKRGIPQMILAGASVDDVYVIVLFAAFLDMMVTDSSGFLDIALVPVSLVLGVVTGLLFGLLFVRLFKRYHMRDTNKILLLLSFSLFFLALEDLISGTVPFSGLLAIFAMGITLLAQYERLAKRLVVKYEKIWVFTELLLFVLVGAAVNLPLAFAIGWQAILLVVLVLLIRSFGTFIATSRAGLLMKERVFTVFAYLPKATVQASIAGLPFAMGIAKGEAMLAVAVLAILITAPLGAFLTDFTKHRLVEVEPEDHKPMVLNRD